MTRVVLKIVGAQGQGVNSIGEICAKGLKRAGYCVFGYREYMSLIKGGHSCYQLDVSDRRIGSSETKVNILVALNHHGLNKNAGEVKDRGIIIHQTPQWEFTSDASDDLRKRNVTVLCFPSEDILKKIKGKAILGNMLIASAVWSLLGRDADDLKKLVREQFERKGEELVQMNFRAIDEGFMYTEFIRAGRGVEEYGGEERSGEPWSDNAHHSRLSAALPASNPKWKDHMLITGSQAMGLGLIRGGCRFYAGYPMTPASPLLTFIADAQNYTGMVVKQAEDEITAAQMMSGAMYMGTRAATGTSGGGFDLMTETVSLNGIVENPSVFILAQRPGPGTGLPTWTAQGDLLLAVGSAHGEFARCVMSVSDAQDCFDLMPEAFNIAEEFQTPVIVMTDKHIAEGLFTQERFDQKKAKIRRGNLITDPKQLKKLKSSDRYDPAAADGISPRWLPGAEAATYCAQGDEHDAEGAVNETAKNAVAQMEKRMRKMEALRRMLPEPELWVVESGKWKVGNGDPNLDLLVVSWGSNKDVILDAINTLSPRSGPDEYLSIGYLHYTYLWPMKTERLKTLMAGSKRTIIVECNAQGQLGMVIRMASGIDIKDRILKFDGRPFFCDELSSLFSAAAAIRHQ